VETGTLYTTSLRRSRSSILPHLTFPAHQPDSARRDASARADLLRQANNVREAIAICWEARIVPGDNGVTLQYSPAGTPATWRAVRTYEGTPPQSMTGSCAPKL
jgi:hypothetical protein